MIFGRNIIIKMIENDKIQFKSLPAKYRADIRIAYWAVYHDGLNLEYVADKFKNYDTIVQAAVQNNPYAIKFAHSDCFSDLVIATNVLNKVENPIEFVDIACRCAYKHPEIYKRLPLCYFEEENKEHLKKIHAAIMKGIKDRVGKKVTKEDEKYATNVIEMIKSIGKSKRRLLAIEKNEQETAKLLAKAEEEKKYEYFNIIEKSFNSINEDDNGKTTASQNSNIDIDESEKE